MSTEIIEIEKEEYNIDTEETAIELKRELTPAIWQMIHQMAPIMYQSRLFGVSSPDQAAAIMLKGYELGLSITASFEFVQVIKGKPGLSPRGALAILHNSPAIKAIKINRLTDKQGNFQGFECTMTRQNGFTYRSTFTLEDAKRAGLIKPDSGWQNYPENMALWRAVGFAADVVGPDITAGMTTIMKMPEQFLTPNEMWDHDDPPKTQPPPPIDTGASLNDLIDTYGPEKVMDAMTKATGGQLPSSDEEIRKIEELLI